MNEMTDEQSARLVHARKEPVAEERKKFPLQHSEEPPLPTDLALIRLFGRETVSNPVLLERSEPDFACGTPSFHG